MVNPDLLVAIAVPPLLALMLIVGLWPRPVPGRGPRSVSAGAQLTEGTWNAFLHDPEYGTLGGSRGGTAGRFDIAGGRLSFTPEGAIAPAWVLDCRQISVRTGSGFLSPRLTLCYLNGALRCTVSRETINRFVRNTAKHQRQGRYAREVATVLIANGASPM